MRVFVYVGSFNRASKFFPGAAGMGITAYRWDGRGRPLRPIQTVADVVNPSWLAIDEQHRLLYATSEVADDADCRISAFAVDAAGRLTLVSTCSSGGSSPCHLSLSPDGETLIAANYGTLPSGTGSDASLAVCETRPRLRQVHLIRDTGTIARPSDRQDRPHAHASLFSQDGSRLWSTDLGLDRLTCHRFEPGRDPLLDAGGGVAFSPGSGPRHLARHPHLERIYVVHELSPAIEVLAPTAGGWESVQRLELGDSQAVQPAALVLAPGGDQIFASLRGVDSVIGFALNGQGKLAGELGTVSTGRTPRDMAFSPDGTQLLVANQDDGTIVAFSYDRQTGGLSARTVVAETGSPSCLRFCRIEYAPAGRSDP